MASTPTDACPHCPPGMDGGEMSSMPTDCAVLDPIDDPDLVHPVIKASDLSGDLYPIAAASWLIPQVPTALALKPLLQEPSVPFHGPPTHVVFCVYLN